MNTSDDPQPLDPEETELRKAIRLYTENMNDIESLEPTPERKTLVNRMWYMRASALRKLGKPVLMVDNTKD